METHPYMHFTHAWWPGLLAGKHQLWEGGIRAAAFVSGGLLPPKMRGANITALVHICDWWVTFTALAGGEATDGDGSIVPKLDGMDQWPVISGASATAVPTSAKLCTMFAFK